MTKPTDPINGCIHGVAIDPSQQGLTKREHFAAMALAGVMSWHGALHDSKMTPQTVVQESLDIADLLIAKLNA